MIKISVITPTLNSEEYIETAIVSVLNQHYNNYEHIIIDGGSSDNTLKILKKYSHLKWISEKDSGQSNAMNKGFSLSTGDIIVYLNSDDYFEFNIFNKIIKIFSENSHIDMLIGNVKIIDLNKKEVVVSPSIIHSKMLYHWEKRKYINDDFAISNFPNNPVQYFYKRKVAEMIPFNESNCNSMDLEFLLQASSLYKLKKLDEVFGVYVVRENAVAVLAKNNDNYWSIDNFHYIDKYLNCMTKNEIIDFKNTQNMAYLNKILKIKNELINNQFETIKNRESTIQGKISDLNKLKNEFLKIKENLNIFLNFIDNSIFFKFLLKFKFYKEVFFKLR